MMDLKELFGDRFKITTDPAAGPRNTDPWLWMIPCRRWRGEIYPQDLDGKILASLGRTQKVKTALRILEGIGCEVYVEGDWEFIVTFPLEKAEAVFEAVKPRRKRRLSEKQREECAKRLKKFRHNSHVRYAKSVKIAS